jgi:orotidine-5'-phosphate decarboxylase
MSSPIIVALDYDTREETLALVKQLDPNLCRIKLGSTLFTHYGPRIIDEVQTLGFEVFLDLKFHDIPKQVAGSCYQAAQLGVWMMTIHCSGGEAMMMAAREAVDKVQQPPILVGVTVLTSMSSEDLSMVGYKENVIDTVLKLGQLAKFSGLDGIVSSAMEAKLLREELGDKFLYVTPGIRLPDDTSDDQKRIMTPSKAMTAGSSYLVIGRAITQASEPVHALQQIWNDIK